MWDCRRCEPVGASHLNKRIISGGLRVEGICSAAPTEDGHDGCESPHSKGSGSSGSPCGRRVVTLSGPRVRPPAALVAHGATDSLSTACHMSWSPPPEPSRPLRLGARVPGSRPSSPDPHKEWRGGGIVRGEGERECRHAKGLRWRSKRVRAC